MRDMVRNRRVVWYALYEGEMPLIDSDGYDTGETTPVYSVPIKVKLNVSPATGGADSQMFGDFLDYTHTIATMREFPFDEQTLMWIDVQADALHNYRVRRVAKSLNGWLYAIKAVSISDG